LLIHHSWSCRAAMADGRRESNVATLVCLLAIVLARGAGASKGKSMGYYIFYSRGRGMKSGMRSMGSMGASTTSAGTRAPTAAPSQFDSISVAAQPIESLPTSSSAPTAQPTTAQPTTAQPTTAQPTTAQPTTAQPTTAQPTTAQPTTAQPTTAQPTTAQPTTAQPTTAQPTTAQPTTAQPTPAPTMFVTDGSDLMLDDDPSVETAKAGSTGSGGAATPAIVVAIAALVVLLVGMAIVRRARHKYALQSTSMADKPDGTHGSCVVVNNTWKPDDTTGSGNDDLYDDGYMYMSNVGYDAPTDPAAAGIPMDGDYYDGVAVNATYEHTPAMHEIKPMCRVSGDSQSLYASPDTVGVNTTASSRYDISCSSASRDNNIGNGGPRYEYEYDTRQAHDGGSVVVKYDLPMYDGTQRPLDDGESDNDYEDADDPAFLPYYSTCDADDGVYYDDSAARNQAGDAKVYIKRAESSTGSEPVLLGGPSSAAKRIVSRHRRRRAPAPAKANTAKNDSYDTFFDTPPRCKKPARDRSPPRLDGVQGDDTYYCYQHGSTRDSDASSTRYYSGTADVFTYAAPEDAHHGLRFVLARGEDLAMDLARRDSRSGNNALVGYHAGIYETLELYAKCSNGGSNDSKEHWYAGVMTRRECQQAVHGSGAGAFLVRRGRRGFVLCVNDHGTVVNYEIAQTERGYILGDAAYGKLHSVIAALRATPIFGKASRRKLVLRAPARGGCRITELYDDDFRRAASQEVTTAAATAPLPPRPPRAGAYDCMRHNVSVADALLARIDVCRQRATDNNSDDDDADVTNDAGGGSTDTDDDGC